MEHNVTYNRMQPEGEVHQGVAQPTIVMTPPAEQRYITYDRCANVGLGVMQLICGLILITLSVSTDSLRALQLFCHLPQKEVSE